MKRAKLFLAVPFSSRVKSSGAVESVYRAELERLIDGLRHAGNEVFCAVEYTQWHIQTAAGSMKEFEKDFEEIGACDQMIVLLEERVSSGIQLEMGYAYAKQKHIHMYQIGKPTWSNTAFSKLNGHEVIPISDIQDFTNKVLATYCK